MKKHHTPLWGSKMAYGCGGLSGEGDEHPLGRPAMQPRTQCSWHEKANSGSYLRPFGARDGAFES